MPIGWIKDFVCIELMDYVVIKSSVSNYFSRRIFLPCEISYRINLSSGEKAPLKLLILYQLIHVLALDEKDI